MALTHVNGILSAGCAALLSMISGANILSAQETALSVPFLTVRDLGTSEGSRTTFGGARSTLRGGRCSLEEFDTGALSDILESGPTFLREQLLTIEDVSVQPPNGLVAEVQSATKGALALYVHGYFIDFDKGFRRAALLQKNAGLKGRMIWFTWPSDGDIANYVQDEADLHWSVPDIASAIIDLNMRSHAAGETDVIGHSLGGRGVALALAEIAFRAPETRLGDVVLLAPDMDFGIFARLLPRIRPIARRITIYVSNEDRPLDLSEELHGYPRLGQAGNDVASLKGIEVVDVSRLPSESVSGHLYHIHNSAVGRDLDLLLNRELGADERPNMEAIGANVWSLAPD